MTKKVLFTREQLKGNSTSQYRTQSLFWELRYEKSNDPVMALGREPRDGLPSIYQEYIKFNTEYEAAMWILGDWKHWQALCKLNWFQKHKKEWDEEREARHKSTARNTLLDAAATGNITAAKTIYGDNVPKRGRPSKLEKQAALNSELKDHNKIADIFDKMER